MATLNELGRNSASITYGVGSSGSEHWPTLQLFDMWVTNDTLQGYVVTSGSTVTGVGSVFTTQLRSGDVIMIAGQMRTVLAVATDTSFTVTQAFSPDITVPSAVKFINTSLTGTVTTSVRGSTYGTVSVTNGSATITGLNTYFLSDATNSVATVAVQGTVAIDTSGNITGTGTLFSSGQGIAPAGQNGLFPGDSIAVTLNGAVFYFEVATVTSDTAATVVIAPSVAIAAGASIAKATNGVVGRSIVINGRVRQITAIQNNTSMTVNVAMDFTDSNLKYRVLPRGSFQNSTVATGALYGTASATGAGTVLTVNSAPTGNIIPGCVVSATTVITPGTTIVNQLYGASGGAVVSTTLTGTTGTTSVTVGSTASIVVGQLVSGNAVQLTGIDPSTYVAAISGTTVTLSKPLSASTSTTAYFYTPGSTGGYTTSLPTTISAAACMFSTVQVANGNLAWDYVNGDTVWIGDEQRQLYFSPTQSQGVNGTTNAYLTDYTGYSGTPIGLLRQTVFGIPALREDSYITAVGTSTAFLSEVRVGDDLIVNGSEVTVTQVLSNYQMKVNYNFTHNATGATVYKKKKIHGFVKEGTREGVANSGKFTTQTTSLLTAGSVYTPGTSVITVASATNFNQNGLIKIQGAGGPPVVLTGVANVVSASTVITGTNTLFTTQLHVGAEICIAGQYLTVTAIISDTQLTVLQTVTTTGISPIYRTVPLYTYISAVAGAAITLGHPIKNTVYSTGANSPAVTTPSAAGDFIEYVYSAPNKSAESSIVLFNNSLDRKYFAFRFYPLATGGGSGNTLATAGCAYNLPVYERWSAAYAQTHGVGVNKSDQSDGTSNLNGVIDQTIMTATAGGFIYLYAKPRYFIMQGKSFANIQTQWLGCVEFERAQPEDTGSGLGISNAIVSTSTGVTIVTGGTTPSVTTTNFNVSPWPCFAYFNGNRFPVGSTQIPTSPVNFTSSGVGTHGGIFAVPRVRCSTGDLVGANAHIYSAATITTGRWGHLIDMPANGSYTTPGAPTAGNTAAAASIWQPHVGHLVPVYTNVYNSKRFMFSPVVVLGPAYDPDIRGRIYGLKVIPSGLGTLMDTVSVTIDSNDFYDNTVQTATDHWVITASTTTYRLSLAGTNNQSTRSLEDPNTIAANTLVTNYANNFRWAIPT